MTPVAKKARLLIFSLSVKIPIKLGTIINKVHHPLKKTSILKIPRAFPPKMIPRAMMAKPQMIDLAFFKISPLYS